MKSKILLKRTLPIIIALFVILVVALVATVVTLDKKVPSLSKELGKEAYLTYTNDGVSISMTNNDVYSLLRDENYGASASVTELVRMIDEDLLKNGEKNYFSLVKNEDVREKLEYAILGYSFEDYEKANEKTFKVEASKNGKSYENYLREKVDKLIDEFIDNFLTSNGTSLNKADITFDGTKIDANTESAAFKYYMLEEAKYLYAREYIEEEYKTALVKYNTYLSEKESYEKYQKALSRYEADLAKWKEADKKTRGDKPVKDDYIKNYTVRKDPDSVSAPVLVENSFKTKYEKENPDKFYCVIIPYGSSKIAGDALDQNGVKIEDGKWLDKATGDELTEVQVVNKIIDLYNQYYQNLGKAELTTASLTPSFDDEESEFYYTSSTLSSLGIYARNTTNKAYNYESGYAYNDSLSSNIFLICGREKNVSFADYLESQNKKYYETEFYTSVLAELLDDATTSDYIKKALAKLRYESSLLIYDETLEKVYMSNYTSDYKATKKASKTIVASYKIGSKKYEISADQLFEKLAGTQYGVSSFVYKYQYNWMFLEAKDLDGNLFNTYVDYKAYLNGTSFKKASKDSDMYDDAKKYVENVKANFKANAYAGDEGTGYNKKYGWKAFIHDYYYENYNVELNSEDDLMVFFVYQKLMDKYQEYVSKITLDKWNNVYRIYMAKTASEYMSLTCEQAYIRLLDADGAKVDPINWTASQIASAKELYDEILAALPKVEKSKINEFFSGLETAFDNAPKAINGAYTGDYAYNYVYAVENGTAVTVNVSKYKSLGFDLTSSTASFSSSSVNTEIKYAARQIWNSLLPELVKGKALDDLVIYDTTWTPKSYYGIGNGNYLASSEGFVVLACTSASYTTYFKTVGTTSASSAVKDRIHAEMASLEELHKNDIGFESFATLYAEWVKATNKAEVEEKILNVFKTKLGMTDVAEFADIETFFVSYVDDRQAFLAFPELEYVLIYLYDKAKTSEDDYTSISDLYGDYEDAVKDNEKIDEAKEAIMKIVKKYINNTELNINFESFDDFLPFLSKYAGSDTSSYVLSSITTWFTSYSSTSPTLVYGDFASTNYANREMFKTLLANLNANFESNGLVKKVMEELVNSSIENASSSLSYLSFTNGDKEAVEELINAVITFKNFDVSSSANLDVLFTFGSEYNIEKATYTSVMESLEAYALAKYNALDQDAKAELQDLAEQAGWLA